MEEEFMVKVDAALNLVDGMTFDQRRQFFFDLNNIYCVKCGAIKNEQDRCICTS